MTLDTVAFIIRCVIALTLIGIVLRGIYKDWLNTPAGKPIHNPADDLKNIG